MRKEIFVFGSNLYGRHGKGAALDAKGRTGDAYAIPTMDMVLKPLPLFMIELYVKEFLYYAKRHTGLIFKVTRVGCGLAGYTDAEIAPMFKGAPKNCRLPEGWRERA